MAQARRTWRCRGCGQAAARWQGRCSACGAWNTFEEEAAPVSAAVRDVPVPTPLPEVPVEAGEVRVRTGIGELDRALGGGLVAGSLVLIGGDPGVGKSTLLLLAADRLAGRGATVLYASGEESARQIRLRADRLGIKGERISLLSDTDLERIEACCRMTRPNLLVLDSVQTLTIGDGMAGSPSQVREAAHMALVLAKSTGTAVVLVGHVTKSGDIAGPKLLEHLVDTVLAFEGDGRTGLRVLRAVKNRFGASGELGLFEMGDEGLIEVPDASARLLMERAADVPGTAVVAAMEGTRPVLAEVQALVGRPGAQMPARTTVGVDRHRLLMLTAVLGKVGLPLYDRDLFANAAGGLDLGEPAADLAIVAALASSYADRTVPADTVWIGEVGLVGEVRAVGHARARLREASRHGFRRAVIPATAAPDAPEGMLLVPVRSVREALELLQGR